MRSKYLTYCVAFVIIGFIVELSTCRSKDFDAGAGTIIQEKPKNRHHHQRNPKIGATKHEDEFDINHNRTESTSIDYGQPAKEKTFEDNGGKHGVDAQSHNKHKNVKQHKGKHKSKGGRNQKAQRDRQAEQERDWHYCSDGKIPKDVKDLDVDDHAVGHMCRDLYPTSTCCFDHDLTMELVGDKILEQVPELQCARMLMKLRCAHCSPRSWWLFHAPDMIRHPHKRVLPIMCPSFCRKFHRLCRDSVAGLESDNFCEYHTTNEEGPCFPDSFVKRGTID